MFRRHATCGPPAMLLHASCAALGPDAVLFLGPPGSGKSDLVLRLIEQGWRLVADDQLVLAAAQDRLWAACPRVLRGMLEVRGLGIFSELPVADPVPPLRLAVRLAERAAVPRLPEPACFRAHGLDLPEVALHGFEASAPAKVAWALRAATGRCPPTGRRLRMSGGARPLVLVTGLSGAGKASILKVLEDLGYETVDNPPLDILESLVNDDSRMPLAAGIDTRTRGFDAPRALAALIRLRARPDVAATLVFATAEPPALLRRYTETRRRHPLAPGGPLCSRVADGIARETAMLAPLREAADLVIDTTGLPLPELRRLVEQRFRPDGAPGLAVLVQSFAFPKGLPREADLVFDLRFLRNPHYEPALKPRTGHDPAVAAYIEADPDFAGFWQRLVGFIDPLLPRWVAEGKKYLTVALGCTGGRHRSVLVAERLGAHLRGLGWRAEVLHRELASDPASPGNAAERGGREALTASP